MRIIVWSTNITFTKAHKAKGHSYPYDFPYDYGTHFIWTSLDEVDIWDSKENQRANYKNNFEGKNVFITMSEITSEIEKYYEILWGVTYGWAWNN